MYLIMIIYICINSKIVIRERLIISFMILEGNRIFCLIWIREIGIIKLEEKLIIEINSVYIINFNNFGIKSFFFSSSINNIFFFIRDSFLNIEFIIYYINGIKRIRLKNRVFSRNLIRIISNRKDYFIGVFYK